MKKDAWTGILQQCQAAVLYKRPAQGGCACIADVRVVHAVRKKGTRKSMR